MKMLYRVLFILIGQLIQIQVNSQTINESRIKLGAYYFDGWTGKTFHITPHLKDSFSERMPKWGWVTSTPKVLEKQIEEAYNASISFFTFCWYYNGEDNANLDSDLKNNAIKLFLNSKNKYNLEYNVLIANHDPYKIKREHWSDLVEYWCKLFDDPLYLKSEGLPLISFFSLNSMLSTFESSKKVNEALQELRNLAKEKGFPGVKVAVCIDPQNEKAVKLAERCGFDVFTGYNYHRAGFNGDLVIPIDSLIKREVLIWDSATEIETPYIPVTTLNWDKRPWQNIHDPQVIGPRYSGFSEESVFLSVRSLRNWMLLNPNSVTREKICMVYAWNEYGEGAFLTPTKTTNFLLGLKKAIEGDF